jgi:hypothetical protein
VLRPLHLAKAPRPPLGRRTVSLQPLARAQPPRPLPEPAVVALQPTETNAAATYSAANDDTIDDAYDDAYDDDEFIVVVTAAPLKGLAELQRARVRNLLATHTPSCKPENYHCSSVRTAPLTNKRAVGATFSTTGGARENPEPGAADSNGPRPIRPRFGAR